jgi:DNA polymerase-3 subunit alpha
MSRFIHLHTHSHYSLLSALPKIPDLVSRAKACGMTALALTDNCNLYGAIEFYKECKKVGIKPIIGIDAYLAVRSRKDRQAGIDNRRSRLVLLAKNQTGYKNLIKMVTAAHLDGFYYKPRIDRELLEKFHDGLIAIAPSISGDIVVALKGNDFERAKELATYYHKLFGKQNFFLEITRHEELEGHKTAMEKLVELGKTLSIPLVAAHDVYYLTPEDKRARNTLQLVNTNSDFSERSDDGADFSFIDSHTAETFFSDLPEAIENTQKIADQIDLELELGKWSFPAFTVESGLAPDDELKRLVYEGLTNRNVEKTTDVTKRIEYELLVIKSKGYAPYFLVVADLLRFAREHHILTNIRGSVSGSMVTFLAGITNINPIEYDIPFERFLNPDRPSAPDIDMDYADNRRDEVIDYVRQKYGADRVAQIGTFGTMMARGSVRDVARALGYPYSKGDEIAKLIPFGSQGFPMSIDRAIEETPDLKALYEKDPDTKIIIDMAKKIEGCARHIGVHAAGVVIAPTTLTDFTPLQYDPKGENKIITQYDMYSIEEAGLLKFDFLGLKNLTIIADTIERIAKIEGKNIDVEKIPLDDKKTFAMLTRGETADLFQLNGDGMTRFLKELRPTTIHDINAMVALYRPGPIQFIPNYIERKHNPKLIRYFDPALKPILEKTYGILVYQDDLLMMAHQLAGYSWGEVDKFRKAVGKKIPEEMEAQKEKFIKGCINHSRWPKDKATEVWRWIEPFAAYGFNKAHSVSYGRIAYLTAYLKANYPEIYLSAVLSSESGEVEKVGETIGECKRLGIPVLPPSVNESYSQFTVVKSEGRPYKIRFGLVTIKNFGQGISTTIIEERKRAGRFVSLDDFLKRIKDRNLNKKSLEALIKSGALDEFGDRGIMSTNIEKILEYNREQSSEDKNQSSLFGASTDKQVETLPLSPAPVATLTDKLAWEKELLGLYISGHPLDKFKNLLEKRDVTIKKVREELKPGMIVVIGGIIEEARTVITKNNDIMAFVRLADLASTIEVVVFPKVYEEFKKFLVAEKCVAIKARISDRNGDISLVAEKVKELT